MFVWEQGFTQINFMVIINFHNNIVYSKNLLKIYNAYISVNLLFCTSCDDIILNSISWYLCNVHWRYLFKIYFFQKQLNLLLRFYIVFSCTWSK